jgi:hypothetical protein
MRRRTAQMLRDVRGRLQAVVASAPPAPPPDPLHTWHEVLANACVVIETFDWDDKTRAPRYLRFTQRFGAGGRDGAVVHELAYMRGWIGRVHAPSHHAVTTGDMIWFPNVDYTWAGAVITTGRPSPDLIIQPFLRNAAQLIVGDGTIVALDSGNYASSRYRPTLQAGRRRRDESTVVNGWGAIDAKKTS